LSRCFTTRTAWYSPVTRLRPRNRPESSAMRPISGPVAAGDEQSVRECADSRAASFCDHACAGGHSRPRHGVVAEHGRTGGGCSGGGLLASHQVVVVWRARPACQPELPERSVRAGLQRGGLNGLNSASPGIPDTLWSQKVDKLWSLPPCIGVATINCPDARKRPAQAIKRIYQPLQKQDLQVKTHQVDCIWSIHTHRCPESTLLTNHVSGLNFEDRPAQGRRYR